MYNLCEGVGGGIKSHQSISFFCKMCLYDDAQTPLCACVGACVCVCVCVCVRVCPFIDVCEGPGRGAKSKVSGHNWVTGTSDGLKHG